MSSRLLSLSRAAPAASTALQQSSRATYATSKPPSKTKLEDYGDAAPDLGDFIAGVVPRDKEKWDDYKGQLKLEKGELQVII